MHVVLPFLPVPHLQDYPFNSDWIRKRQIYIYDSKVTKAAVDGCIRLVFDFQNNSAT